MNNQTESTRSNQSTSPINKLPRHTWKNWIIDKILSYWIFLIVLITALIIYWILVRTKDEKVLPQEKKPLEIVEDTQIEGIYYGTFSNDSLNCEPFPATVTRSSNGTNHYLLSMQGHIHEFYYNKENGILSSTALGTGTLIIDSITNEIIIEFEGWILKH